ncbi:deoxyribo dipyrimidine photolyase [Haloferula helveola]|uniref:Deoxyribo dipyrimidine photolyase n=1 Tax=Haloferula helveola TaxID=490095 RepID=A0ABM7RKY8_9BACT|nr:deoxyribo dipyrimidine photolyase [Haloferula helveola]
MRFPPTRDTAIERLESFLPNAAKYAKLRNFDFGPAERSNVSGLSPYLRTRLITEDEVSRAVLGRFAASSVDKFLQEVAWRTYWKGWLEMRPQVWDRYLSDLDGLDRSDDYDAAIAGRTGIDCFDSWARELVEHGYLHNHTRMWFASIWVFTLRLPWQLGADFFMRHLLDGDPASNTLSWRWVAGLHTKGKHYLARASNIAKYTDGRFNPTGQLDESAGPLPQDHEFERMPLELQDFSPPDGRIGHLVLADDLAPPPCEVMSTGVATECLREAAQPVHNFLRGALEDTRQRYGGVALTGDLGEAVQAWVADEKLDAIVVARPAVGPWRQVLDNLEAGVPVHPFVREWDRKLWPSATAGFFKLRKQLPKFFDSLAVSG